MSLTELEPLQQIRVAEEYARQSEKLSLERTDPNDLPRRNEGRAIEASFVTPLDPVIETGSGNRLPAVPVEEAHKINLLKDKLEGRKARRTFLRQRGFSRFERVIDKPENNAQAKPPKESGPNDKLYEAIPPAKTHPLFPPLPLYGPPTPLRDSQCAFFRVSSAVLSTCFLLVIVLGSLFTSIPVVSKYIWLWLTFRDPDERRPFVAEERRRALLRKEEEKKWQEAQSTAHDPKPATKETTGGSTKSYIPTEGGPDRLICDARYYARRVGLDMETFRVQTEDGFIVELWHVFDPQDYVSASDEQREQSTPEVFEAATNQRSGCVRRQYKDGNRRYPVLLMHGLLQSAGAYCCADEDSLAFYLCKAGYDVWLGNNRCGFHPEHTLLKYSDPRMWAWNIRQMGVMDLPAFVSRVLHETGFERLGLVCHSQGTTETFVALAKEQRPELGDKISVFCALAPAVYAGPLIGKMYFKFMRAISPSMFRLFFGIHAFIPLMMAMHTVLPGKLYGAMGYKVFSFLFNWSDDRWDRALRDRFFQFSPVYVSSESMRWWLGRECFAKQKCVLSTKEEGDIEDNEDETEDMAQLERREIEESTQTDNDKARTSWYNEHAPPMALWVAGSDELVDGQRLLRRFERGREPLVDLVHSKVIPKYEHLDVLWALDAIEQVGSEVKEVLWRCMTDAERQICRSIDGAGLNLDGNGAAHSQADDGQAASPV